MNKISEFINSNKLDEAFSKKKLSEFYVLDPFARRNKEQEDLKQYIAIRRVLRYPTVSLMYIGQALLSVTIWVMVNGSHVN